MNAGTATTIIHPPKYAYDISGNLVSIDNYLYFDNIIDNTIKDPNDLAITFPFKYFIIYPASAVIKVNDASKKYGDDDPEFTGTVEGLYHNVLTGTDDQLGEIKYCRQNTTEDVGVYEGVLSATVSNPNPNYRYTVEKDTFTIYPMS